MGERGIGYWPSSSWFGTITDAPALASKLEARAGIIEHGFFLGLAQEVIVAGAAGVRHGGLMPVPMEPSR